jgi:hypothetical protein
VASYSYSSDCQRICQWLQYEQLFDMATDMAWLLDPVIAMVSATESPVIAMVSANGLSINN